MKTTEKRSWSLTTKLVTGFLILGLVPLLVLSSLSYKSVQRLGHEVSDSFVLDAEAITEKIDRNLFERYGDVQAFALNDVVQDKSQWYRQGSQSNRVVQAMNSYVALYALYALTIAVDLEGRVIAVNDADIKGKPVETAWIYGENFKSKPWFQSALEGKFLKSASLDGTYVEDLASNELARKVYSGDGFALTFTAPIKSADGKVVGVWHNIADFSFVEEIVVSSYAAIKKRGLDSAAYTLLDAKGRVLIDYDPSSRGGKLELSRDPNVVLKANLAESGSAVAVEAVSGRAVRGQVSTHDSRRQRDIVAGFASSQGAMGFPGLGWHTLVSVDAAQARSTEASSIRSTFIVVIGSVAALLVVALWLGRSLSRPISAQIHGLRTISDSVAEASVEISAASQMLAEGSSDQAASLEETSAAIEEIASMTRRTADNARTARESSSKALQTAQGGAKALHGVGQTMGQIREAVQHMQGAVKDIETSGSEVAKIVKTIDEIAFQTNILALNAAVEAARAGEAGLGFAVVADEVRNLAQRSAQAAKDTAEKIDTSIQKSANGVRASEAVVTSLAEVSRRAGDLEESFQAIVQQTEGVNATMNEIATATEEQSTGLSQISLAVSRVDKIVQTSAAGAEETASASQSLKAQARQQREALQHIELLISGSGSGAASGVHANVLDSDSASAPSPAPAVHTASAASKPRQGRSVTIRPKADGALTAAGSAAEGDIPMPHPTGSGNPGTPASGGQHSHAGAKPGSGGFRDF